MQPVLFPVGCFLVGCIAAMFTRSKFYAIVLPSLVFPVVSTIWVFASNPPREIGEVVVLTSPYIVAACLMGLMYSGVGALITWQIRGEPGPQPPSKALLRHIADPISVRRYCDKYGVTQAEVKAAIGAGKMKAYSERGIDFVEDEPPLTMTTTDA